MVSIWDDILVFITLCVGFRNVLGV